MRQINGLILLAHRLLVLGTLSSLLMGSIAMGDEASRLKACDLALQACSRVVYEEGASITILKSQVSTLENRLADAQSGPIVPTWLVIASSLLAGVAVGYTVGHH